MLRKPWLLLITLTILAYTPASVFAGTYLYLKTGTDLFFGFFKFIVAGTVLSDR